MNSNRNQRGRTNYGGGHHGNQRRGGYGHHGGNDRGGSTEITAPYGFVPLAPIVEADWLATASEPDNDFVQDVPFIDGVSGTFDLLVHAETPICVAGPRSGDGDNIREMYRLPHGLYAIPGSSLRGALRNVVEIASFGRMHLVNDHRYAVRDLHNRDVYGDHMAGIQPVAGGSKKEPMPLVNAGWLSRVQNPDTGEAAYHITPCHFAKVEYGRILDVARQRGLQLSLKDWGQKRSAPERYKLWRGKSRDVSLPVELLRKSGSVPGVTCNYGKVSDRGSVQSGTLVFTGQPSNYDPNREKRRGGGNPKHHDFFFYGSTGESFKIPPRIFKDFEFAHSDRGQQGRMVDTPNEEWAYWKNELDKDGGRVPIFFLRETRRQGKAAVGDLRAFGLAMMFRLAYRNSIGEAVANVQGDGLQSSCPDLAEAIFGTVRKVGQDDASNGRTITLRGRLLFSHAIEETNARPPKEPVTVVLGAPKASYYPNYVEQDPASPGSGPPRGKYKTWMDEGARPRGWKRYRPHEEEVQEVKYGSKVKVENVGTKFKPLNKGARFRSTVVAHNLRPMELGALIWALDFGGYAQGRHMLGLARPLGYGRSRMSVENWAVNTLTGDPVSPAALRDAFVAFMEERLGGTWEKSWQIRELLALVTPQPSSKLRYQRLDAENRINEFVDAKKTKIALPRAGTEGIKPTLQPSTRSGPTASGPASSPRGPEAPLAALGPAPAGQSSPEDLATELAALTEAFNAADMVVKAREKLEGHEEALKLFARLALKSIPDKTRRKKADKPYMKWLVEHGTE